MCDQAVFGTKDKEVRQTERCETRLPVQAASSVAKEAQHVATHFSRFGDVTN